jgi:hypothetical protein
VVVLTSALSPVEKPVLTYQIDSTNAVGPGSDFNIATSHINIPSGPSGPLYVFIHLKYKDAFSTLPYEQVFYKKWTGTQGGGQVFIGTLFNVNREERAQMATALAQQLNRNVPISTP